MTDRYQDENKAHWLLAKMGKRVLRPGGKELTIKMIEALQINEEDQVVEFAPGIGFTAALTLKKAPQSYIGVELNEEAAKQLQKKFRGYRADFIQTKAEDSGLPSASQTKVYGEAMLTMHAPKRKEMIVAEAARILKPGGYYAIHELGLRPNDLPQQQKDHLSREMAINSRVNTRPLTQTEWCQLLEQSGFSVEKVLTEPMHLLEPKRVLSDEGLWQSLKIVVNLITHPKERKRVLGLRSVFRKYQDHIQGIALIAKKK